MPNEQIYQLLAHLMTALQANGFRVGTGQQLRLQHLMKQLPEDISLDALKTRLAPIFVKNKEQQQLFYELFEDARQNVSHEIKRLKTTPKPPKNRFSKWIWIISSLILIALAVVFWYRFDPPEIYHDYLDKPLPIVSETIVLGDTATVCVAPFFRSNDLLKKEANHKHKDHTHSEALGYTLCNGLHEDTDLGVGKYKLDALGCLTYIPQDTGQVRTCVTVAFQCESSVEMIIDTVLIEIEIVSKTTTADLSPENTEELNVLNTRPLPIKRILNELGMPQPEGWAKAYFVFEQKWDDWIEDNLWITDTFFVIVLLLLFVGYFRYFKSLIQFKKAVIRIPYNTNFALYKDKITKLANNDTDAAYVQLIENLDSDLVETLKSIKQQSEVSKQRSAGSKGKVLQKGYNLDQPIIEGDYTLNQYESASDFYNFKEALIQLIEKLKESDIKKAALQNYYTLNFNKILNILVPIVLIVLGLILVSILLLDYHLKFLFCVLIGGLIWAIAQYVDDNKKIVAELDSNQKAPFVWNIQVPNNHKIVYNEHFYLALNQMRQRTEDQFYRLNIPETVKETIKSGGQIKFQYTQQTRPPEYLMLIDRRSAANHQAALFNMLFEAFRDNDVIVERFYFDGDIRLVKNETHPHGIRLKDLKYQFQNARLLILSDGYNLLNARSGKLAKWVTIFSAWKDKAIMTPNVASTWGRRERQLAELFVMLPSTVQGFQYVIEAFEDSEPTDFSRWQKVESNNLEKIEFKGDLMVTLNHYFTKGENRSLVRWIAACAVYPTIHWDLTLSIGKLLADRIEDSELLSLDNLLAINRLPWFVEGKIPNQVREELLIYLEENDAEWLKEVRGHLHELLQNNPPPTDSVAFEDYQMNVVINEMMMTDEKNRQKELEEKFRRMVESGIEPDVTILKYLDRPKNALDFYVPEAWKKYVFNDAKPFLGRKQWTWAMPIWLVLSVLIMGYSPVMPNCDGSEENYNGRELCIDGFENQVLLNEFKVLDLIQNEEYEAADEVVEKVKGWFKNDVQARKVMGGEERFYYKQSEEFSMDNISFFKNVATAYYNKAVPYYNKMSSDKLVYKEVNGQTFMQVEGGLYQAFQDTVCNFFSTALELDSTVQIYQKLVDECNTGEKFSGYILPILKGKIADKKTKKPLSGVIIKTSLGIETTTNAKGEYTLTIGQMPILELSLDFVKRNYDRGNKVFELKEGLETLPTLYLNPKKSQPTIPSKPHPKDERKTNDASQPNGGDNINVIQEPLDNEINEPEIVGVHIPLTVYVKGGTTYIGNDDDKRMDNNRHQVTVASYNIGQYEVTNKEYLDFLNREKVDDLKIKSWIDAKTNISKIYKKEDTYVIATGYQNHPVVGVTWTGAVAYCEWLSKQTGKTYRLPTEAEWEYAARGSSNNTKYIYSGSNDLNKVGWYSSNGIGTYVVGKKAPNNLKIYDMSGNVWEWCSDWYGRNYFEDALKNTKEQYPIRRSPKGPIKGTVKVLRGGSFDEAADKCRVDFRFYAPKNIKAADRGFRVVLEEMPAAN